MTERLWAPWRMGFLTAPRSPGCFLCEHPRHPDLASNLVLESGTHCFVCLNLYPYTTGHLLVAPNRHIADLGELQGEELGECMACLQSWVQVLKAAMNPDGFNIGLNQGQAAGAAVADHLHFHLVPRWKGDHNFMSVVADMRIIHQSLSDTYELLKTTRAGLKS